MAIQLFPKQKGFFESNNRINIYAGGIQSGKTTVGALKMAFAINLFNSPEDNFIIAADTYKTLSQATIPRFLKYARRLGALAKHTGEFKTIFGSTVYLRTATDPESVEGITNVRRIWIDEGGKVSKYFFENVMGRAAFLQCPIDITTTPYALNWLADLCDQSKRGDRDDISFTQCRSIDSPYFPQEEYDRQRKLLDPRRFAMKYDGVFGKMEGLVYDKLNLCNSFALPAGTRFFAGVDWGFSVDPFCLVIRAVTLDRKHFRVFEYYRNFLTVSDICHALKGFRGTYKFEMAFCDPSQPAYIEELNRNGIPAMGAKNDIRYGIDQHYQLIKEERFWIFKDLNPTGITEYETYHYREPTELKFDQARVEKETMPVDKDNHGVDADRYLTVMLNEMATDKRTPTVPGDKGNRPKDLSKKIEWLKKRGKSQVIY